MKGMVAVLIVSLLMPVAAVAQEWRAYAYNDPGFVMRFPGVPTVETSRIKNVYGTSLPVTRYVVRHAHLVYTLSVVNYANTNADPLSTIVETERTLGASGKVTAARGARIHRHFGRELTLQSSDGSRSAIAIYFVDKHLFTVVGQELPPLANEQSDEALRFQESLQFADDDSGFGRFFGGDEGDPPRAADSPHAEPPAAEPARVDAPHVDAPHIDAPRVAVAHADATCAGKSAGDTVQLQTAAGPVAAICTLVARPIVPPSAAPP